MRFDTSRPRLGCVDHEDRCLAVEAFRVINEARRLTHDVERLMHEAPRLDVEPQRLNEPGSALIDEANRLAHAAFGVMCEVPGLDVDANAWAGRAREPRRDRQPTVGWVEPCETHRPSGPPSPRTRGKSCAKRWVSLRSTPPTDGPLCGSGTRCWGRPCSRRKAGRGRSRVTRTAGARARRTPSIRFPG